MLNKKYLPLKILHLLLVIAGLVMYAIVLSRTVASPDSSPLSYIIDIVHILAFVAGFIYLIMGYGKKGSVFYKLFMWLLIIAQIFKITSLSSGAYSGGVFMSLLEAVIIVLFVVLAASKDFGESRSNVVASVLVILQLAITIASEKAQMYDNLCNLILAATVFLLVTGKYLDKSDRGKQ